jgi:hypothetical protein
MYLIKHSPMKTYGGVTVYFIIQIHAPAALSPWKEPRYPLYRRLGRPRVDLDAAAKRKVS